MIFLKCLTLFVMVMIDVPYTYRFMPVDREMWDQEMTLLIQAWSVTFCIDLSFISCYAALIDQGYIVFVLSVCLSVCHQL